MAESDQNTSDKFYTNLPALELPPAQVVAHRQYFHFIPPDWSVVIADVKNSTGALRRGHYEEVNLLAAGSVIVALNLARERGLDIPFVYGGDGSSLVVPPSLVAPLLAALAGLRRLAANVFHLDLRVGALKVEQIEQAGYPLKVAKILVGPGYHQALFLDVGLYYAERLIKDDPSHQSFLPAPATHPNLAGLHCRWSSVAAPEHTAEIVCLIVTATKSEEHDQVYREVLEKIDAIYGDQLKHHPLHHKRLQYALQIKPLVLESYARFGKIKVGYIAGQLASALISRLVPSRAHASEKARTIANSDVLKIDGSLKTIIAGGAAERQELLAWLHGREAAGELTFGHFVTSASFLTCFVPQESEYINFLDGHGGGYTQAASELKQKQRAA